MPLMVEIVFAWLPPERRAQGKSLCAMILSGSETVRGKGQRGRGGWPEGWCYQAIHHHGQLIGQSQRTTLQNLQKTSVQGETEGRFSYQFQYAVCQRLTPLSTNFPSLLHHNEC